MKTKAFLTVGGAAAIAAVLAMTGSADAAGVKIGVLSCHVSSGWGFIFGSSKDLRCEYSGNRYAERYVGAVSKFGVDIGYTAGGVLVWNVFAPTAGIRRGALAGSYAGATASATVGLGAGANVLVGGSDRSISLQPLSIEGNSGLNVAAGIGSITLRFVGPEGPMGPPPGAMPPPPPPGQ